YSAAQCGTRHRSWYWYAGLSYCALQGLHRPSEVPGSHSLVQSYSQRVGRRSTQRSNSDCYWLHQTGCVLPQETKHVRARACLLEAVCNRQPGGTTLLRTVESSLELWFPD